MPQGTAGGGSLQVSGPPIKQWAARGPMKMRWHQGASVPKRLKNKQHQPAGWADFMSTPGPSEPINLGELDWPSIKTAMDVGYSCVPESLPLLIAGYLGALQPNNLAFHQGLRFAAHPLQ